jgi:hypothetical protein
MPLGDIGEKISFEGSNAHLLEVSRDIPYLPERLVESNSAGGTTMEALIGAAYIDSGHSVDVARDVMVQLGICKFEGFERQRQMRAMAAQLYKGGTRAQGHAAARGGAGPGAKANNASASRRGRHTSVQFGGLNGKPLGVGAPTGDRDPLARGPSAQVHGVGAETQERGGPANTMTENSPSQHGEAALVRGTHAKTHQPKGSNKRAVSGNMGWAGPPKGPAAGSASTSTAAGLTAPVSAAEGAGGPAASEEAVASGGHGAGNGADVYSQAAVAAAMLLDELSADLGLATLHAAASVSGGGGRGGSGRGGRGGSGRGRGGRGGSVNGAVAGPPTGGAMPSEVITIEDGNHPQQSPVTKM